MQDHTRNMGFPRETSTSFKEEGTFLVYNLDHHHNNSRKTCYQAHLQDYTSNNNGKAASHSMAWVTRPLVSSSIKQHQFNSIRMPIKRMGLQRAYLRISRRVQHRLVWQERHQAHLRVKLGLIRTTFQL